MIHFWYVPQNGHILWYSGIFLSCNILLYLSSRTEHKITLTIHCIASIRLLWMPFTCSVTDVSICTDIYSEYICHLLFNYKTLYIIPEYIYWSPYDTGCMPYSTCSMDEVTQGRVTRAISWPSYLYNRNPHTWKDCLYIETRPRLVTLLPFHLQWEFP